MAVVNGYATLAELKARLDNQPAEANDPILEQVIEAASRQIDGLVNRTFYQSLAQIRTFTADMYWVLDVDDLVTVTTLLTDTDGDRVYETTWATTDYDLGPENAAIYGRPYTRITLTPNTTQSFPTVSRGVKITGTWGWPSIPDPIKEACLLQAIRLYQRKHAPFGMAGQLDGGELFRLTGMDPDVKTILEPFRRVGLAAV